MDVRQLRSFVKIVELGSFSKASRHLHVAQPALSQQIVKVEDHMGKPLLVRSPKGVTPNEAGLALYHHAQLILRQFDQAIAVTRADSGAVRGMVSIGLPATTVAAVGLSLVRRLRQRYPGIVPNVVEAMSGHIDQLIHQNQLDLAILFSGELSEELSVEPLMVEELFLFIPEESDLLPPGQTSVTVEEVSRLPLVLPTSEHGLRRRIDFEFQSRALELNVVAEIDSMALLMNCVHENIGAAIKPMGAIMQEGPKGRKWRCLSFSDTQLRRSNFLYSLPPESLTSAATVVAGELKETVRDLIADPRWKGFSHAPNFGLETAGVAPGGQRAASDAE